MVKRYLHFRAEQNTLSDTDAPTTNSGTLMGLLGGLANRLRAITGKGSWTATPDATLADAATHHGRTDNPHSVTRGQLGAAAATALNSHAANQQNPHGVTAAQARARADTWVPGWSDVTGKPVSFPSTWTQVASKPTTYPSTWTQVASKPAVFPPETHTHDYAPSSHVGSRDGHPLATQSANGLQAGADKSKLDSLVPPQRVYSTPGWTEQIIDVTANGWQTTMLAPEITVPALGEAPTGFRWLLDIEGAIRISPPPSNVSLFLAIGFDRAASASVDGGGPLFASSQGALPVSRYGIAPPATNRSFTVNFYFWTVVTGSYSIRQGPLPACRAYLVAA